VVLNKITRGWHGIYSFSININHRGLKLDMYKQIKFIHSKLIQFRWDTIYGIL
jgi:hypothetical protein